MSGGEVTKEIEFTSKTEIKSFKARIKASKPHFVQKVMQDKTMIKDALEPHFCSYITIFVPKLKAKQREPVVMCHISNGAGSVLFRCSKPQELATVFRDLADRITSDRWLDNWIELESIADKLQVGEIIPDDKFVDVGDFTKRILNPVAAIED